ncbi:uncharacterized protein ATNIH1004_000672 [Aspergillus tanneri]|uniref:Uncharacterized protein n=1 Tax=Aspergillus tanneri TaxID=1220188 RepID=A0A5M9N0K6_9EURO|nr:uncharacterized protein ATNIH1004_000672 [Aspergillus tanneri]KAA8651776.1 hypothetical protein ATNIH1004_000672 [Aspergillus tanneri]
MSIPNTSMGTTWCGEIPVELETRKFHTRVDEGGITDFVGGWNDETNAAWDTILDEGLIKLTEDQARRLLYNTRNPQDPSTCAGALEVFLLLHCFVFLFLSLVPSVYFADGIWYRHQENSSRMHVGLSTLSGLPETLDHCFDYLRQNIMCWSDTTISSLA